MEQQAGAGAGAGYGYEGVLVLTGAPQAHLNSTAPALVDGSIGGRDEQGLEQVAAAG